MKKTVENEIRILDKKVKWILIFGGVVLIFLPILVTQLDWFLDFTATGEIGDTLSGTTAPVIGAVSALLIYFSFRAQINANRIIQNQIDDQKTEEASKKNFEHQMERYKHLREHIIDFTYSETANNGTRTFKGSDGLIRFLKKIAFSYSLHQKVSKPIHEFTQVVVIISFFIQVINHIKPEKDDSNSKFIYSLTEILFYNHLWNSIKDHTDKVLNEYKDSEAEIYNIFRRIRDIEIELAKLKTVWPN